MYNKALNKHTHQSSKWSYTLPLPFPFKMRKYKFKRKSDNPSIATPVEFNTYRPISIQLNLSPWRRSRVQEMLRERTANDKQRTAKRQTTNGKRQSMNGKRQTTNSKQQFSNQPRDRKVAQVTQRSNDSDMNNFRWLQGSRQVKSSISEVHFQSLLHILLWY